MLLWCLLLSCFTVSDCGSDGISSGIEVIKQVVKVEQKPPAKSNVLGWGKGQAGTRTASKGV